jgi:Cation transporting ATPase, C-terminus
MKAEGATDGMARTAAVNAITLGQVFYLLNSRYLLDSSLSLRTHMSNPYLWYGIGAAVVLQLLFTYAPPFHAIFGNESLPARDWPWLILGAVVFFLVVELEKLIIRSMPALRRGATRQNEGVAAAMSVSRSRDRLSAGSRPRSTFLRNCDRFVANHTSSRGPLSRASRSFARLVARVTQIGGIASSI